MAVAAPRRPPYSREAMPDTPTPKRRHPQPPATPKPAFSSIRASRADTIHLGDLPLSRALAHERRPLPLADPGARAGRGERDSRISTIVDATALMGRDPPLGAVSSPRSLGPTEDQCRRARQHRERSSTFISSRATFPLRSGLAGARLGPWGGGGGLGGGRRAHATLCPHPHWNRRMRWSSASYAPPSRRPDARAFGDNPMALASTRRPPARLRRSHGLVRHTSEHGERRARAPPRRTPRRSPRCSAAIRRSCARLRAAGARCTRTPCSKASRFAAQIYLGTLDGAPVLATANRGRTRSKPSPRARAAFALDLRSVATQGLVPEREIGLLAQAKSLSPPGYARHRFCANCGAPTAPTASGFTARTAAALRRAALFWPRRHRTPFVIISSFTPRRKVPLLGARRLSARN